MTFGPHHVTDSICKDLKEIGEHSSSDLRFAVNQNVLITGASGFIGTWLTLSWVAARKQFGGTGKLLVTSRNPSIVKQMAHVVDSDAPIATLSSDIRRLHIPSDFHQSYIIHAATPASASLNIADPMEMLNVIMEGQGRVLFEAKRTNSRVLFLSSGAIYGKQPMSLIQLKEDWNGGPILTDTYSAYHEGKRIAELIGNIAAERGGLHITTARPFAFIAPFLPFATHFAAGNFMKNALESSEIEIISGGGSVRSYQYATDLCSHLWALMVRGDSGVAYNVGSDTEVSIRDLANQVANIVNPEARVVVKGIDTAENMTRYVPSINKIKTELGVQNHVALNEAIERTARWAFETEQGVKK